MATPVSHSISPHASSSPTLLQEFLAPLAGFFFELCKVTLITYLFWQAVQKLAEGKFSEMSSSFLAGGTCLQYYLKSKEDFSSEHLQLLYSQFNRVLQQSKKNNEQLQKEVQDLGKQINQLEGVTKQLMQLEGAAEKLTQLEGTTEKLMQLEGTTKQLVQLQGTAVQLAETERRLQTMLSQVSNLWGLYLTDQNSPYYRNGK